MNKDELRRYFSKELRFGWYKQYQAHAIFEFLINVADFCDKGVLLDAGAGRQRYKPFFEKCIYVTQEHEAGISMKNMQAIEYDIIGPVDVKIPLKSNTVDGVLSTSTIEHLRYPDKFIAEAYRILKPGGRLFINCPFCYPEHEEPFDFNRPTRYGLQRWLEDAGFTKAEIMPSSSSTEASCAFLPVSVWGDIRKGCKDGRDIFRDLLKEKNGHIKVMLRIPRMALAKLCYICVDFLCGFIKLLIDKGPHAGTNFPVGWLVVATKPGAYDKRPVFKDKSEFLSKCRG